MEKTTNRSSRIKIKESIEVNLLTTRSAGKSTLLNAFMNEEILPTENKDCTAVIFKIFNSEDESYRAEVIGNNSVIESYEETDKISLQDKLKEANKSNYIEENDIEEVRIYGRIPFIRNTEDNLILVDRPRPNNTNNMAYGMVTDDTIKESDKDLVLYIMDGTTISSNDYNELLYTISDSIKNREPEARDRIIFVVNRLDNLKEGENIDGVLEEVEKLLAKYGIEDPNIYPVSGLSALRLRELVRDYDGNIDIETLLNDKKYEELGMMDKFNESIHLEKYSSLKGIGQEKIQKELEEAIRDGDKITEAIIHTGIRSLEEGINQVIGTPDDKIREEYELQGLTELIKQTVYEENRENPIEVNILATMSAGKSTILNALMNKEILPSENRACTAIIFKIFSSEDESYRAEVIGNNSVIESYEETDKRSLQDKLKEANRSNYIEENDIEEVRIYGRIPFIENGEDNLILVDTPGPNNVNNEAHGEVTKRIIDDLDRELVLYIMDATTVTSNDSDELLSRISDSMKKGGLEARDRIIFVVNKLDNLKEDESIEDILDEVRKLLKNHGIEDPSIYPVSGLYALRLRQLVGDYGRKIDREKLIYDKKYEELGMMDKLNESIHLEDYSSLKGIGQENIQKELEDAIRDGDEITEAIIHTGIRSLEEGINQIIGTPDDKINKKSELEDLVKNSQQIVYEKLGSRDKFNENINLEDYSSLVSTGQENIQKELELAIIGGEKINESVIHTGRESLERGIDRKIGRLKMANIYLEYNPYTFETIFKRNGEDPKESSYFNDKVNEENRLQDWIEDLPEKLHEEINESEIEIDFKGTKIDFEDLEMVCSKYTKCEFLLNHVFEEDISKKEEKIEEMYKKIVTGPMEELKDEKLLLNFKKSIESTLEVNILATMSAGKSTVLNAIINKEVLPSENKACTAVIFKIFSSEDESYRAEVIGNNSVIESYEETDKRSLIDKLKEVNKPDYIEENDIEEVRIYGRIPFLGNTKDNLILVDTPGPNNANNKDHGMVTHKMINESDKDLVLYIMDGTTISSNDSNELLSTISDSMEEGGLQARDRIIFVVNKLDNLKEGENIDGVLEEVEKLLAKHGIEDPNIYPVSGLSALKLRNLVKDYNGNIDTASLINDKKYEELGMIDKFNNNIHLEKYSSLKGMGQENIQKELEDAIKNGDKIAETLIHTGIRSLEEAISQYLNKYFKTDKIRNTITALENKLKSDTLDNKLKQDIAKSKENQESIKKSLDKLKDEKDSGDRARELGKEIDKINLEKNFNDIGEKAQIELGTWKVKFIDENKDKEMKLEDAKKEVKKMKVIINKIEKKSLTQVEKDIEKILIKNSKKVIEKYKDYLRDVSKELSFSEIDFDMKGILDYKLQREENSLINKIIKEASYEEEVVVGEERRRNYDRKWYKPWTLLTESKYYYVDIVENQEFVDLGQVLGKMMDSLERAFDDNINRLIKFGISKESDIKKESKKTLEELDQILDEKLGEIASLVDQDKSNTKILSQLNKQEEYLEDLKKDCKSVVSF